MRGNQDRTSKKKIILEVLSIEQKLRFGKYYAIIWRFLSTKSHVIHQRETQKNQLHQAGSFVCLVARRIV